MKKSLIVSTALALAVVACMALPGNAFAGTKYTGIVLFNGCNLQQCSQGATAFARLVSPPYTTVTTPVYQPQGSFSWVYTFECDVNGFGIGTWEFRVSNCNCGKASSWSSPTYINCNPCNPLPECGLPFKLNICDLNIPIC